MTWLARFVQASGAVCLWTGMALILVQSFWNAWGVFARYVLARPDQMVTEATALLLVPVSMLGLAEALRADSFPRVSFLMDRLSDSGRRVLWSVNLLLMALIGAFFAAVAVNATVSTYRSGAASSILEWPEFLFWAPTAAALVVFVLATCVRLARRG